MKKLILNLIASVLLISILNSCDLLEISIYEGNWKGTTSQELAISFHVNSDGTIDELNVTLDCDNSKEYLSGTGSISDDECKINISNSGNVKEDQINTVLEMSFTSEEEATGSIDHTYKEEDCYSYISGSSLVIGCSTSTKYEVTFIASKY
ncbi:MAG: hypothetical protein JXB17_04170 [Bacteroidales bacterium]|nr:hypothetical protein [Bacteroidales bacterium]